MRSGLAIGALAALATAVLLSCLGPEAPRPDLSKPTDAEFRGIYDPRSGAFKFPPENLSPLLGPLRLLSTATTFEPGSGMLRARIVIRNVGSTPVAGPDGVAIFGLAPAKVTLANAVCDPPDAALPPPPPGSCLLDHRSTFGADGMLSPGETSRPVEWVFRNPGNVAFQLRARLLSRGLAGPGEISGLVFDDRDGDTQRDPDEPGVWPGFATLAGTDSTPQASVDSSGHFSFIVAAPGRYRLGARSYGCCGTGARTIDIDITRRPGGSLSSFSGGEFGCTPGAPPLPQVSHVDVRPARPDLVPCIGAEPCTIPMFTSFKIRFTGVESCDPIVGFQWQSIHPGETNPEPFQPYGSDTLFLRAGRDTVALGGNADTLWTLLADTVTVYKRSTRAQPIPPGNFLFRARVKDESGLYSLLPPSIRRVVLNFDPDTQLYRAASCDCPSPPPGCEQQGPKPAGWITGIDTATFAPADWIPFCAGDTLPIHSRVIFYARGFDDPRDEPIDANGTLREVGFSFRFAWQRLDLTNLNMPFSIEFAADDLALPSGSLWHGAAVGWQVCPFDYTFFASAVDQHVKRDGTPDSIPFFVSGPPVIDNVEALAVIVLTPNCGDFPWCDPVPAFGPDTVVVVGRYIPDSNPPSTPLGLGYNEFTLPLRARGHDHPRDRNAPGREYYAPVNEGGIRAWNFALDCTQAGCADLLLPGEHRFTNDVPGDGDPEGAQVFEGLRVTFPLDTLCTTLPCTGSGLRVVLATNQLGPYVFMIQGRDTREGEICSEPGYLTPGAPMYDRSVGSLGRTTELVTRQVVLRQLRDVLGPKTGIVRGAPR